MRFRMQQVRHMVILWLICDRKLRKIFEFAPRYSQGSSQLRICQRAIKGSSRVNSEENSRQHYKRMARKRKSVMSVPKSRKVIKHTVKYLADSRDPDIIKKIITKSPDTVIKAISNTALNAYRGPLQRSKSQKTKLSQHRKLIQQLSDKSIGIKQKRRAPNQRGGYSDLSIILSAVLSKLGWSLFNWWLLFAE